MFNGQTACTRWCENWNAILLDRAFVRGGWYGHHGSLKIYEMERVDE